jgi:hypothetical protein
MYSDLRARALQAATTSVIPHHNGHPDVYGLVVDIPARGGYATVVALGDNTTSLYTSAGGGTIGAGGPTSPLRLNDYSPWSKPI